MKLGARVKGVDKALNGLNKELRKIEGKTIAGLMAGGLIIQGEAQKRVPVEYGNLRGSAYTRKSRTNAKKVEVGFSAAYALFIHENMEQKLKGEARPSGLGVYWGPNGQPKFLESAMIDKQQEVLEAVAAYAKVSK